MAQAVEFHTGIAHLLDFTSRLLRKAYRQGAQLLCTAPQPWLAQLDAHLWTFEEREFVPHLLLGASKPSATTSLAQRTPIWLADSALAQAHGRVLVNVGAPLAAVSALQLDDWARVIELVGEDELAAQEGRKRWRAYQAAGCLVTHLGANSAKT